MNKIFFIRKENTAKFEQALKKELSNVFSENEKIAVKLHMGEKGNKYFLKPEFVKKVIDVMKGLNLKLFLFDSPVGYKGGRDTEEKYYKTAEEHGFNDVAPIVISDDSITIKTDNLDAEVCKPLTEADGVLVLSHVKGHFCSGFGAAIKNLGMGALSKKTKGDIHTGGKPEYLQGCTLCGECAKACPLDNIRYDKRPYFDKNWCCGCSDCVYACKFNAIKAKNAGFDKLLSEGAGAALSKFKKSYFVNAMINISEHCDCADDSRDNKIVLEDVGILLGDDIVAIDKTSMDLINEKAGKDLFKEIHKKSPLVHIKEAEKLGMGKTEYELEELK